MITQPSWAACATSSDSSSFTYAMAKIGMPSACWEMATISLLYIEYLFDQLNPCQKEDVSFLLLGCIA